MSVSRREAIRKLGMGGVAAAAAPSWVEALTELAQGHIHPAPAPAAAAADWKPKVLNADQDATVVVLSELIIPATETPGAKAALVSRFVDAVLEDADEHERKEFLRGLEWTNLKSRELFGADFKSATAAQQTELLTVMSSDKPATSGELLGRDFFKAIKSLTITGYYTSEIGMKQELGDDGQVFFAEFKGCDHPEHGAPASAAKPATPAKKS
jgi:gluconate 2-dehydrogenase gamma chain